MTRHIPDGDSLRPLKGLIVDLGNALDDAQTIYPDDKPWPANDTERKVDAYLRATMARPVARRPVPWLVPFLFGAAAMALAVALAAFAVDAVQTGAATAVEAQRVAGW